MRVQLYTSFPGVFTIACYTLRPTAAPASLFTAATAHEEFAGLASALLEEQKHILPNGDAPNSTAYPAAKTIGYYFPTGSGGGQTGPLFALKHLKPAGVLTDIDAEHMLEITRLRYEFVMDYTIAAFSADDKVRNNRMRAMAYALKQLFVQNGIPLAFIPGDDGLRPVTGDSDVSVTEVDFIIDFGEAGARRGVDLPDPATT